MEAKNVLDTNNRIHVETLRFSFGHLIQHDLNIARRVQNLFRIRKQPSRDIHGGKPNILYYIPEKEDAEDYKKPINQEHVNIFLEKYATQVLFPATNWSFDEATRQVIVIGYLKNRRYNSLSKAL